MFRQKTCCRIEHDIAIETAAGKEGDDPASANIFDIGFDPVFKKIQMQFLSQGAWENQFQNVCLTVAVDRKIFRIRQIKFLPVKSQRNFQVKNVFYAVCPDVNKRTVFLFLC